jgi:type II secretory pathway component PulF
MKLDELAFVNQQLAGMLKTGLPLEGALNQLCAEMHGGPLRDELRALEADLARGTPFREALAARRLPPFYTAMLQIGAKSNDLPGVLTLLADYYQRAHLIWTRLKGLLVYPTLVLGMALALSVLVATIYARIISEMRGDVSQLFPGQQGLPTYLGITLWVPVALIALLCLVAGFAFGTPRWRRRLRWRLPAFKEASLAQLSSALALMLEKGCSLDEALTLLTQLEAGSPAGAELVHWKSQLAAGHRKFPELTRDPKIIPPLFVWLVTGSGENWAAGFRHAAAVYGERAKHRVEMFLYAVLPVSVLALGFLILSQALPVARAFTGLMRMMVYVDGMGE